jgi:hypothetical protein
MITLLHESVGHADELVRALNLAQESMAESAVQQASKPESKSIGHRGSLENIRHEAERAHSSVHAIVEQLQSLFLKVLQHNPDAGRNAELVREAEEILTRMTHQIQLRCTDWCVSMGTQDKEANLETGFLQVNSADGLRTLQRLIAEYGGLRHLLEGDSGAQSISGAQISLLAQETYRVGLDLLQDALELLRAIDPLKKHRLEMEVRELDIKLVALRTGNAEDERVKLMEATKKSHLERLDIMQNQQLRIEELLHLSGRCEATLQCARIEITALKTADSGLNVEQATESLRKTIERAREVQEELKRLSL